MQHRWFGRALLAAGLVVLGAGIAYVGSSGSLPTAQAQEAECPAGANCLVVIKTADGDPEEPFTFESDVNGSTSSFSLENGQAVAFPLEEAGSITITEEDLDGWTVEDIGCSEDERVVVDLAANSVTVTTEGDEPNDIVCLFSSVMDEDAALAAEATGDEDASETADANETDAGATATEDDAGETADATESDADGAATDADATTTPNPAQVPAPANVLPEAADGQGSQEVAPAPATGSGDFVPPTTGSAGLR